MPYSADRRAATRAWWMPSTVKVASGSVTSGGRGPSSRTPGMAASPARRGPRSASSCSMIAFQPIRSNSAKAVPSATAPMTLGEPASSRSGGSVHATSSRSTRSTAPPPARKGSPSVKVARGPMRTPAPNGAYILCPLQAM